MLVLVHHGLGVWPDRRAVGVPWASACRPPWKKASRVQGAQTRSGFGFRPPDPVRPEPVWLWVRVRPHYLALVREGVWVGFGIRFWVGVNAMFPGTQIIIMEVELFEHVQELK